MNEPIASLTQMLSDVILPNLKAVQISQAEQIAANDRLEHAIDDLRIHLEMQFAQLTAQIMTCLAEWAATQAALKSAQSKTGLRAPESNPLIH